MHSKNYWAANLISRHEHFDFWLNATCTTSMYDIYDCCRDVCTKKCVKLYTQLFTSFKARKSGYNFEFFPQKKMFGVKLKIACILLLLLQRAH